MPKRRVIVVGAGASGLVAAGRAAEAGAETLLLEKMKRPGMKLAITGSGRCNLTNVSPLPEFIEHFGPNGRFLRQAFSQFSAPQLVDFLKSRGLPTVTERGGRVFPASGRAEDVVEALSRWVAERGATLRNASPVRRLLVDGSRVVGVSLPRGREYRADAVVLATGGASYPATGSTGDGYELVRSAGHTVVPIRPALVPVETAGRTARNLQGLSLKNVTLSVWVDEKKRARAFGEMLFTHFGLSGPIVLALSGTMVDALRSGENVSVSIDLKPALDDHELEARLLRDLRSHGRQRFGTLLKGLLPAKLVPLCAESVAVPRDKLCHQLTALERKRLRLWLKDLRLEVTGHRPFEEAIITAGGVDIREVDPRTMASRLVDGLYLTGELLDVDGDTGGYNLQAAFSTGWVAGRAAAMRTVPRRKS